MYVKFSVKNFRCFSNFIIEPFDRVNLIAGKNNVGKTALLEALWIHHGSPNPDLGFRINRFRGIKEVNVEQPLLELFHKLEIGARIELSSVNSNRESRLDQIYVREPSRMPLPSDKESAEGKPSSVSFEPVGKDIVTDFTDESGQSSRSVAYFLKDEVRLERAPVAKRSTARFLVAKREIVADDVEGFSDLEVAGQKNDVVDRVRLIEPRLKDLTVVVRGGSPTIWGDIGIGLPLPLQVMGDGICRWLLLVQAILRSSNGIVLIDEIENGIHHSVMGEIWTNIGLLAREYNVQVFATTHSAECVRYAHQAFLQSDQYDFRLHRLEQVGETSKAVTYDKETLGTALEAGLEFR